MSSKPPLRIAILIERSTLDEWQYQMLEKIHNNGTGSIVSAVVLDDTIAPNTHNDNTHDAKDTFAQSLLSRYLRWDLNKFAESPSPYGERALTELNTSIVVKTVTPQVNDNRYSLAQDAVNDLLAQDIDVLIQLSQRFFDGEWLSVPKYGVWSYVYGGGSQHRNEAPGIWEHYNEEICTHIALHMRRGTANQPQVLDQSAIATDKTSVTKTRFKLYWRSATMLPRKIAELHNLGYEEFNQQIQHPEPINNSNESTSHSNELINLKTAPTYIWRNFSAYINRALFQRRYDEKWMLYFKLGNELSTSVAEFKKIESSNDRYWADPHTIERDGIFYVFVEEFMYKTNKGRIAVIPISKDGTVGPAQCVLETDYHLSYPFLLEHDGETYMVPESSDNRTLDLYRCIDFPNRWEKVKPLLSDIRAKDTTLLHYNGLWWMFTNLCELHGNSNDELDELYLFYSTDFLSDEWTPHSKQAVASDVRWTRPGGTLFQDNGKLYRPAQDCSEDYGYAMQLQEITELTPDEYHETLVSRITPDWNERVIGVHTLSYVPGITVVDAKTRIKKRDMQRQ